jgi:hypothetical protein
VPQQSSQFSPGAQPVERQSTGGGVSHDPSGETLPLTFTPADAALHALQ